MLGNQLHQGGTRALLDWDNDLFINFTLPEEIAAEETRDLIIDQILLDHGDAPLAYPDPNIMKYYIGVWSKRMGPLWLRYYNAIIAEYNPLENYDREEDRTVTRDDETGNTRTLNTSTDVDGTITTSGTETTENSVSAENVNVFEPDDRSVRTPNLTDTHDMATKDTGTITDAGTFDGSEIEHSRIHGNIGVTTSQQMLISELDLVPRLDLIKYISDNYAAEFCLGVY